MKFLKYVAFALLVTLTATSCTDEAVGPVLQEDDSPVPPPPPPPNGPR